MGKRRHRRQHISACFTAWALLRSLRRLTNQIRHNCDQDNQAQIAELAENTNQANEFHDSRTVCQRARDIAGTALEPRGSFYALQKRVNGHSQTGTSTWEQLFEAQKVDTTKTLLATPGPPLAKIRMTDLRRALLRQRTFKAHPQDTLPPELS